MLDQPPAWVRKRDGRVVPFDADKIGQALFAATEALGKPDAFLARELTDGILHFLAVEQDDDTLPSAHIAEIVGKTVRELGQPALAEAFAAFAERRQPRDKTGAAITLRAPRDLSPRVLVPLLMREYARQTVFTNQLMAAQNDGLLTIMGLDAPGELAGCVMGPFGPGADEEASVIAMLNQQRRAMGGVVVFDGPEHVLLDFGRGDAVAQFAHDLKWAIRLLEAHALVNLNSAEPPPWVGELARGPLFAEQRATQDEASLGAVADQLLECLLQSSTTNLRIYWHLAERDFMEEPARQERLRRVANLAAESAALAFVFDRPRRPLLLAEGIDRQHPAALLTVGLHLPRLAAQSGSTEAAPFLQKLGSLTRLALSAGTQKREYLRRLERQEPSALTTGFLLDRVRLVLVPLGLDTVVQQLTGRGLTSGGAALDLGKQIVMRMREVVKQETRASHLEACLDGVWDFSLEAEKVRKEAVAGLTAWDATAPVNQIRAAGALHAVADGGVMALFLDDSEFTPDAIAERLRQAWTTSDVARLRICRTSDS